MEKEKLIRAERHKKGWGYEDWMTNNKYCGKLLHFDKEKRCSVHYHKIKDETFYLLRGRLEVMLADSIDEYEKDNKQIIVMGAGDIIHIWPGRVHQMKGLEESDLIEISTKHFEEDSYRILRGD